MVTRFKYFKRLLGAVKITKNSDPDKYVYTGYGIVFDSRSEFSLPDGSMDKNVVIFGVDMSSSLHIDNKKKDILILSNDPAQGSDNKTLTAEAQYSFNFSRSNRKICLSFSYNGSNSFLFVNATKTYQFKVNYSEIKKYPLCLRNISRDLTSNNMKKTGLNGYVYEFSVNYNIADTS